LAIKENNYGGALPRWPIGSDPALSMSSSVRNEFWDQAVYFGEPSWRTGSET
jgi:hypothetical protein